LLSAHAGRTVLAMLASSCASRTQSLRVAPGAVRGALRAAWRRPARAGWAGAPDEMGRRAFREISMLRIYNVVIAVVGGAGRVAGRVEQRDADLARQMRRALASVALNVAEGSGNTAGHKRQRYQSALGSAREVMACIDVAKALRYVEH